MAENQKSVFIRFNMDDERDRELYQRLSAGAGNAAPLTAYAKKAAEEVGLPDKCEKLPEGLQGVLELIG